MQDGQRRNLCLTPSNQKVSIFKDLHANTSVFIHSSLSEVAFIHVSFPMIISVSESATVSIDADQANAFLSRSRRNVDLRWHRQYPDFQSYYRYYSSIGHTEGVSIKHIQHAQHCTKLQKKTTSYKHTAYQFQFYSWLA